MSQILALTLGSILGGLARYFFQLRFNGVFPTGTLLVNLLGCFLVGLFSVWAESRFSANVRLLLMTGFCGAFTTFSAFMLETDGLLKTDILKAFLYVALSLFAGFILFKLGTMLGRLV